MKTQKLAHNSTCNFGASAKKLTKLVPDVRHKAEMKTSVHCWRPVPLKFTSAQLDAIFDNFQLRLQYNKHY